MMKMKNLYAILVFLVFVVTANAQVSKTINVSTAGTLTTLLTADEKANITDLTVTGNIDTRDVKCMRDEITKLAVLDLSSVNIMAYTGKEGTSYYRQDNLANVMPASSFCKEKTGKISLKTIILPNRSEERRVGKECRSR